MNDSECARASLHTYKCISVWTSKSDRALHACLSPPASARQSPQSHQCGVSERVARSMAVIWVWSIHTQVLIR
jgi:hypothetical protein